MRDIPFCQRKRRGMLKTLAIPQAHSKTEWVDANIAARSAVSDLRNRLLKSSRGRCFKDEANQVNDFITLNRHSVDKRLAIPTAARYITSE